MLSTDRITVMLTTYNRERYFKEALDCLLSQTVRCPVIVIDDASDHDRFERTVRDLCDPLVTYVRNPVNLGIVGTWNRCIDLCPTPWLSILHDDDLLGRRFISSVHPYLEEGVTAVAAGCIWGPDTQAFDAGADPPNRARTCTPWTFLTGNLTAFPGVVFDVATARRIGGFKSEYYPSSDVRFWIDLMDAGRVLMLNSTLAFYRISPEQDLSEQTGRVVDACHGLRMELAGRYPWPLRAEARRYVEDSSLLMKKNYEKMYGRPVRVSTFDAERLRLKRAREERRLERQWSRRIFAALYAPSP